MSRSNKPRGWGRHTYLSNHRNVLKEYRIRGNRMVRRWSDRVLYDVQRGGTDFDEAIFPTYPQERFDWWYFT